MQCASCRFENMPGVGTCGRCGSPLGLKTLAVDVHPPRAGAWTKRLRRLFVFRSVVYEARDAGRRVARESWFHDLTRIEVPGTHLSVLARLIVPGWAHFHLDERIRGGIFLGAYLALLLLALVLYGTTVGSMLLGLAFSVHVASCLSILRLGGVVAWAYLGAVVLVFVLLLVGVYLPVGWLVTRVATPALVQVNGTPFEAGDVILYSPAVYALRAPRPGDVVLYHQEGGNYELAPPQHGYIRIDAGQRIDRILAGPGDQILWKDHLLTVNGAPSPWQPLNPGAILPDLELTVPAGHYLILPTAGPPLPAGLTERAWHSLAVVSTESIRGRAYLRSYPFSRIRRFS
jgi:Signal peptidase, peptidase S26